MKLATLDNLRSYVEQAICEQECLQPGAFPLEERLLRRGGRPCGLHFALRGPRSTYSTAIWDAARHAVLFYDSKGERFRTDELRLPTYVMTELERHATATATA
ncbi:MAG: hypothetical protein QM775_09660 [Pirellulales bacterium]